MFGTSQDITESKLVEVELPSAMAGDRERLLAAGMSDYKSKPLDRRRLIELVDSWRPGDTTTRETPEAVAAAMEVLEERYAEIFEAAAENTEKMAG